MGFWYLQKFLESIPERYRRTLRSVETIGRGNKSELVSPWLLLTVCGDKKENRDNKREPLDFKMENLMLGLLKVTSPITKLKVAGIENPGWEGCPLLKGERREEVKFHKVFEPRAWADSRFSEGRLVSCALGPLAAITELLFSSLSWLLPGSSTLVLRARINSESPSRQWNQQRRTGFGGLQGFFKRIFQKKLN